jgi:dihydrofolate reductase
MKISIIAAQDINGTIGKDGQLPWHLPSDLKHFKHTTSGSVVIMGRKCFESIGKALPNRKNIVITRNEDFKAPDCYIAHSLEHAFEVAEGLLEEFYISKEVFVIGGGEIYKEALPYASTVYLTLVWANIMGDHLVKMPDLSEFVGVVSSHKSPDDDNIYDHAFIVMKRIGKTEVGGLNIVAEPKDWIPKKGD